MVGLRLMPFRAAPRRLAQLGVRYRATAVPESGETEHLDPQSVKQSYSRDEIQNIYDTPLLELVYRAASAHRLHQDPSKIQLCTLMNIKSGGCSEDCSYCSQSSRYKTATEASRLLKMEPVLEAARQAKANGSTRFCMGAAWRDLQGRKSGFERILEMVREIRSMGMEVCTTLGMLTPEQARRLKEAGLTAYNHNLDTSREFYPKVITTRSYDDRLTTIDAVREAGISVCSGGILGLGESHEDRVGLIWEVANMPEHPESFPVNALVPIEGTPLEKNKPLDHPTILRTIATARIVLPKTIIRLSAGRQNFSESEQAMCFLAGANAIFTGEKMLTTPCSGWDDDKSMLERWGLQGMASFESDRVRMKENLPSSTSVSSET
ncbi:biotin synthase [Tulasnella sp. 419]|nr:biotin synthase [Tulasnella sp. 419]